MDRVSKLSSGGLRTVGSGIKERANRVGVALRTLRDCYSEAMRQARLVENDRLAQKQYRKLYVVGYLPHPVSGQGMPCAESTADWKDHPAAGTALTGSGVHEFDFPGAEENPTTGQPNSSTGTNSRDV